jgi:hypothetical protein
MQAAAFSFEVTRDPWDLYLVDPQYGSLGYASSHDWDILQERYLLAFLFEYAATLGLIDVAYTEPEGARPDFYDLWGADDIGYLSRYDGLVSFRLNPLGAYCLGLADEYTASRIEAKSSITALPSLQLNVSGELSPDESLLLETYAEKESDKVWRLSREKVWDAASVISEKVMALSFGASTSSLSCHESPPMNTAFSAAAMAGAAKPQWTSSRSHVKGPAIVTSGLGTVRLAPYAGSAAIAASTNP